MSLNFPLPFPRAYWVIPGKLLAGPFPGSLDPIQAEAQIRALAEAGIRQAINLMEADEVNHQGLPFPPYHASLQQFAGEPVGFLRCPIRDMSLPTIEAMRATLDAIDSALAAGRGVYVHCWGGRGRTGTVIGCYLARHQIAVGQAALDHLQMLRQHIQPYQESPETEAQREFVRRWPPGH